LSFDSGFSAGGWGPSTSIFLRKANAGLSEAVIGRNRDDRVSGFTVKEGGDRRCRQGRIVGDSKSDFCVRVTAGHESDSLEGGRQTDCCCGRLGMNEEEETRNKNKTGARQ